VSDDALLDALRALRAAIAPVTPLPEWVPLEVEAQRRGKSTAALRAWCLARSVEIRESSHRDAWVRPADIDRAISRLPLAQRPASRVPRSEVDDEIDLELRRRAG